LYPAKKSRRRTRYRNMSKGVRLYNGISAAECKGVTMISPGKVWIPGGMLWPSDIAAHFDWLRVVVSKYNGKSECMKVRHWRRLKSKTA
jgi:hypothetical protein